MSLTIDKETILKFDVPGPRYTSYPTAPEWSTEVKAPTYQEKLHAFGQSDKTLSVYIHIPFCESMCYYCACNVVIRKKDPKYAEEYLNFLKQRKPIKQFHWGGGTPTFLTEEQIERLFTKVCEAFLVDKEGEISIEVDPRTIDHPTLKKIYELGFNRISMGVQDFDPEVQEEVNRRQPFEIVQEFHNWCQGLGFHSINYDLIYGLPYQTPQRFYATVNKVIALRPDRIALYSFAYVPWLKKHQSKLKIEKMPTNDAKLDIFLQSREQLLRAGYQAIAMDHFALYGDELAKAFRQGTLYRNFMGYTVKPADEFIGLGLTAIGFLENTFVQNHKTLPDYYRDLKENMLPVERGKVLTEDDQIRQWVIHSLMCRFELNKDDFLNRFGIPFDAYFNEEQDHLQKCEVDGLLQNFPSLVHITDLGKIFIRNVCMGFDWYLRQKGSHRQFSRTV
jgi:oxygen-independent coproporphyrinogen-3 oxidase